MYWSGSALEIPGAGRYFPGAREKTLIPASILANPGWLAIMIVVTFQESKLSFIEHAYVAKVKI